MTLQAIITAAQRAGIVLTVASDRLRVTAPVGALTPEIRAALAEHKPSLLEVLWRLDGMRIHTDPVPTAKSAQDAPGGPGRCFSCGTSHEHPEAYGRCEWCGIAVEVYYSEHGDREDAVAGGEAESPRRTA